MTRTAAAFSATLVAWCLAASLAAAAAPRGPKGPKAGECQAPDVLVCHMDRNKEKPVCVPTADLPNHIGNHEGDYVADADGDGFTAVGACAGSADDCRDDDPAVSPAATEVCNAADDDCDGAVDEGFDADGDGWTTCGGDCDDGNSAVSPEATEVCNAADDDCDGVVDEADPGGGDACSTGVPGVCAAGTTACVAGALVCEPDVPASPEICDGLDNDCDGAADDGDPGGGFACATGLPGECAVGTTACSGGAVICEPDVPASPEICDGLDNDCDGAPDDGDPDGGLECTTGLPDACAAGTTVCVDGTIDCEPSGPLSDEVCDGADNDCDGIVDYVDLGTTVFDPCTNLEWEKKVSGTDAANANAVGNRYAWAGRCTLPDTTIPSNNARCQPNAAAAAACAAATGGAVGCSECGPGEGTCDTTVALGITTVWDWVNQLNAAGFAGHADWRVPTSAGFPPTQATGDPAELESIVDPTAGACGGASGACIDAVFGPTDAQDYWSASTVPGLTGSAFHVNFRFGDLTTTDKFTGYRVRAVRTVGP